MQAPANNTATVRRDGDALVFTGALSRDVVSALCRGLPSTLAGVRRFDLRAVERLDSSGLALLSTLSTRAEGGVIVVGNPPGLDALRRAYRLDTNLGFTTP